MFLSPIDDLDIIRIVQYCRRSTDFSDVNMILLKKVISKIVKPFGYISNASFQTGVFRRKI